MKLLKCKLVTKLTESCTFQLNNEKDIQLQCHQHTTLIINERSHWESLAAIISKRQTTRHKGPPDKKQTDTQSPPATAVQPAKGIKHESGPASESGCQFAENTGDTGTC